MYQRPAMHLPVLYVVLATDLLLSYRRANRCPPPLCKFLLLSIVTIDYPFRIAVTTNDSPLNDL